MNSNQKTAKTAGVLYLLLMITASLSLMYFQAAFTVPGDAAATANKIRASELLFRIGIVIDLVSGIIFIFLVLPLYRLLKEVNKNHGLLMVILAMVSASISFINILNKIAALILLSGDDFLSVFAQHQLEAMAMVFLQLHGHGIFVGMIFWGLWLLPFGVLVFRSGFLPRVLGVLLIINCFAYLVNSVTSLLLPHYGPVVFKLMVLPETGQLWIMLWLLIKGVRVQPPGKPASIPGYRSGGSALQTIGQNS
jgi:uncharacterized protein DUF4386